MKPRIEKIGVAKRLKNGRWVTTGWKFGSRGYASAQARDSIAKEGWTAEELQAVAADGTVPPGGR